jgi:ubiquinone/menaquinone biosynthesis C-methylase UbiE
MKVIDIGCGIDGRSFDDYVPNTWQITGIDLQLPDIMRHMHPNFTYLNQNACDLSRFKDGEFDLAISIGMLEHITDQETFKSITSEIQRVAKQYIIIVPYKYGWIEPHYGVPFFPILPYSIKLFIVKAFNLSNQRELVKKDRDFIKKNYRWLSNAEYSAIFKDSTVYILPTLETIAIIKKNQLPNS